MNQGYGEIMNCKKETFWGKSMKHSICIGLSVFVLITTACQAAPPPLDETAPQTQLADNAEVPLSVLKRLKNPPKVPVEVLLERIEIFEKRSADKRFDKGYFRNQNPRVGYWFGPNGWTVGVKFDSETYEFLVDSLKLIVVSYPFRKPSYASDNAKSLGDIPVKTTRVEALIMARRFVENHWGASALDGLSERGPGLRYGERVYSVVWSFRPTGESVLLGLKRVSVDINVETGDVFYAQFIESKAPETTKIGSEKFLRTVEMEFHELQDLEIERVVLSSVYTKEMTRRSFWSADIRYTCPKGIPITCYGHASIRIDADTGEILEKSAQ